MTGGKQEWSTALHSPAIWLWLALWIVASYMLWRQWKGGTPWPLGVAMPF